MEICLLQNQHQTEKLHARRSSPLRDAGPAPWRWAPCSRRRLTLGAPDGAQISTQGANGAPACVTCHGAKGEGNPSAGFPRLAGLGAKYLAEQLDAMADGGRVSPIMKATAQALDPAQRQAVAAYYASLPAPLDTDKLAATAMGRAARPTLAPGLATEAPGTRMSPPATNAMVPAASASATTSRWRASRCHISGQLRVAPGPAPARPAGPDARRGHPPDRRRNRCRVGLLRRLAPGRRATGRASRRTGSKQ